MEKMKAVSVKEIEKSFGSTKAIKNLSFDVEQGEIYGIIGPDGSGKTTLFRILTSLMLPEHGQVSVAGYDVVSQYRELRKHIGYMPGKFSLYQDLTVEENLRFFATVFNTTVEKNYHLIEDIYRQIEPFKKRRAGKLSGGMKQKLALCCALIHKPEVLFLDEPTTGVDPVSRKEFWEMLNRLKQGGLTILVSTPYMDEASLCDRIALIRYGDFLTVDTPEKITQSYPKQLYSVSAESIRELLTTLRQCPYVETSFSFGEACHITIKDDNMEDQIKEFLAEKGHNKTEIKVIKPSVEDCFMRLSNTDKNG